MAGLSVTYDKYNNMIYAMNSQCSNNSTSVYSLDLNTKIKGEFNWNEIKDGLLTIRHNTSVCMVDKGRFIAVIGGNSMHSYKILKNTELYAVNTQTSIRLKMLRVGSRNAASIYSDTFHQIIMGSSNSFELYDINKDEWIHVFDRYWDRVDSNRNSNIWISKFNPNIIFFSGFRKSGRNFIVERYDLRQKKELQIIMDKKEIAARDEILNLSPSMQSVVQLCF
eukprot:90968_1